MVATVHELASTATAVSYFEKDGYYAKNDPEHRKASFWHGTAAAALNLRGHVVPSRFESVLSGKVPKSDIRLGRLVEGTRQHRPGWDITLSAPKSVSLEALVMGDARVIRAHDEAVRATLDWIERDLLQTRGWDPTTKRRPRVKAHGMVVAGFRHLTSRDLDPQLHTHCVLANMTRDREGAWKSIEPTLIRRSERLIGAHYRNGLAARLEALRLAVTPTMVGSVPGFELAGYDKAFLDAFSGRRREILAYLEKHGLPHTKEATQKATLHTRRRKVEAGLAELVPQWRDRARALGLARDPAALSPPRPVDPETGQEMPRPLPLEADLTKNERRRRRRSPAVPHLTPVVEAPPLETRRRPAAPPEMIPEPETGCLEAVARAVAHVEERRTIIPERDIRMLALGHAPGRYRLEEIDQAIERLVADGELVETVQRGSDRSFVTDRAVKAERRILKMVKEGRAMAEAFAEPETVATRLAGTSLTSGQADAVRHIVGEGDRTVGVQGRAGSGKTTMLRAVADLVGRDSLTGLAPSTAAARVLARETGIPTRTLQWFLVRYGDLEPERLAQAREELAGTVLAVDEASMIGTVQMERLLAIAGNLGIARVVLVGDTAQLKAVDAGQPFALMQKAGMTTAVMDEVLRQKDPELKAAVAHAREGEAGEAVTRLANRVIEHAREDLGAAAAHAWLALPVDERDDCAVLAPTHAIRRQINEAVREGLAGEDRLSGRTLVIERLIDRRHTRVEAAEIGNYEVGDTVVFHRNAYGCMADDTCTVSRLEDGMVVLIGADGGERRFRPSGNAARNLSVYETAQIEIRAGDRIRWTRNRRPRRGKPGCVNGEEMRIMSIGPRRVRMMAADGIEVSFSRADPQLRHLDHAWSSTVHAAQGRTAKKVIAVLDAGGMADQEMFYVEVSRASHGFTLLTDDREALIERLETSPDVPDVALEALGEDFDAPVVDPDAWADAVAAWEAVHHQAERTGREPSSVPGYAEAMAGLAAFAAIEDLPHEMRAFVDARLHEHEAVRAADREVRRLVDGLLDHARRWPELNWAASAKACAADELPAWRQWREGGAALLEAAARSVADGTALANAGRRLRAVRLIDDARRFARDWRALEARADAEGVPVAALAGYAQLVSEGERLADAGSLTGEDARQVASWQARHAAETALVARLESLTARAEALLAQAPGDSSTDPAAAEIVSWRDEADAWMREARAVLTGETPEAPFLRSMPKTRAAIEEALGRTAAAMRAVDHGALLWRVEETERQAAERALLSLDMPGWPGLLDEVRGTVEREAGGTPVLEVLAAHLVSDARRQQDRERLRAALARLAEIEANRPRFADGRESDRAAWRAAAPAAARTVAAAVDAIPDSERNAHLTALGETAAALEQRIAAVPSWLATVAALEALAVWRQRVDRHDTAAPEPGDPGWRRDVAALIAEGRALPGAWRASGLPAGDMAGAVEAVQDTAARLDAALLDDSRRVFVRRSHALDRDVRENGVHALDSVHLAPLRTALGQLGDDPRLSADERTKVIGWRNAIEGWDGDRRRVAGIVAEALALEPRLEGAGPIPDVWRRRAEALLNAGTADALAEAHVRAAGAGPERIAGILEALRGRLADDDAVREARRRSGHLLAIDDAVRRLRDAPFDTSRSIRWDGTEPLLRGDRLTWRDGEGRHDTLVEIVGHVSGPGTIDHLRLRPVGGIETRVLFNETIRTLAANATCRRMLWPDEEVRRRECGRQYPEADASFPLTCEDGVLPGDRVRWTLVRDPAGGRDARGGDTPLIEAVVEAVEPAINNRVSDMVTLRVIRSWGTDAAPAAGSTVRQEMRALFMRGCVRAPWEDEDERSERMAEALRESEARRRGRSRGFSM